VSFSSGSFSFSFFVSFTRPPCSRGRLWLTMAVMCGNVNFPEIKAIEEGVFDEKRYSLEIPLE
jgi:hypothetical protein